MWWLPHGERRTTGGLLTRVEGKARCRGVRDGGARWQRRRTALASGRRWGGGRGREGDGEAVRRVGGASSWRPFGEDEDGSAMVAGSTTGERSRRRGLRAVAVRHTATAPMSKGVGLVAPSRSRSGRGRGARGKASRRGGDEEDGEAKAPMHARGSGAGRSSPRHDACVRACVCVLCGGGG